MCSGLNICIHSKILEYVLDVPAKVVLGTATQF